MARPRMTPTERRQAAERRVQRIARDARGTVVQIHKPAIEPKKLMSWRTKAGLFAAGTAAAAGGATYLHHNRKRDDMKIVKRDSTVPLGLRLHELTPEERRKHVRVNTIGGGITTGLLGAATGASIEDSLKHDYWSKMKWKKGAAIGGAAGTALGAAAFRHAAKKTRYSAELDLGPGRNGRNVVHKLYDPFTDEIVEFGKSEPGQKSHYGEAVSNVSTKYVVPTGGSANRAPGLKLLKVQGKHLGSLPRRTALTHIHH